MVRGGAEEAKQAEAHYEQAKAQAEEDYEETAAAVARKQQLTAEEEAELSRPAAASSYALRATGTSTGGTWVPVTNAPVQVGDDLQVVLQPATATRFFRLER